MNNYIILDLEVIGEIGDLRQAVIICFLLNQKKDIEKVKKQVWKKEYLAKILRVTPKTIYNDLTKLQDNGYLQYNRKYNLEIELSHKSLKWFGKTTQTQIQQTPQNQPSKENIQIKQNKISKREAYLKLLKEKMISG